MQEVSQPANVYWAEVDPTAPNNSHAYSLELVGANKRVLELGPAAGHVTKALVANGCRVVGVEVDADAASLVEPVAERVVVGDLSDPAVVASAIDDERFDVVLGGDVLEHLPDPLRVLRACRGALKPGGYVVLSLPNIAHADVKLQLLAGRFPYRDTGLLDRTHLHFFTLASIQQMLCDAGFLMVDLRRVVMPVFHTELAIDPADVPDDVRALVLADAESETYQFIVRGVVHDGDAEVAGLAGRVLALEHDLDTERTRRDAEREAARNEAADLQARLDESVNSAQGFERQSQEHERQSQEHEGHVKALLSTRSYRLMAPLRAAFHRRS